VDRTAKLVAIIGAVLALLLTACVCEGTDAIATWQPTGPGNPVTGAKTYRAVCASCHGNDLKGVDDLGTPLAPSAFIAGLSEAELAASIKEGRAVDDPQNATGVLMPPSGGAPWLSDQDLTNVAAYLLAHQ
jgi:mono/diheme cytochrome c family protein